MILKEKREELGWSQQELGERLDPPVGYGSVYNWESGTKPIPRYRIPNISEVVGIPEETLRGVRRPVQRSEMLEWVQDMTDDPSMSTEAKVILARLTKAVSEDKTGMRFTGTVEEASQFVNSMTTSEVMNWWPEVVSSSWVTPASGVDWDFHICFPPS